MPYEGCFKLILLYLQRLSVCGIRPCQEKVVLVNRDIAMETTHKDNLAFEPEGE